MLSVNQSNKEKQVVPDSLTFPTPFVHHTSLSAGHPCQSAFLVIIADEIRCRLLAFLLRSSVCIEQVDCKDEKDNWDISLSLCFRERRRRASVEIGLAMTSSDSTVKIPEDQILKLQENGQGPCTCEGGDDSSFSTTTMIKVIRKSKSATRAYRAAVRVRFGQLRGVCGATAGLMLLQNLDLTTPHTSWPVASCQASANSAESICFACAPCSCTFR